MPQDSSKGCCTEPTVCDITLMEEQISKMKQQINDLKTENALLKFTLSNIVDSDKKISFCTGFPSYKALMAC